MQAIDVTRHSRITQQLVPYTTILSFICCSRSACKKWLLMTFGMTLVLVFDKSIDVSYTAHLVIVHGVDKDFNIIKEMVDFGPLRHHKSQ